MIVRKKVVRLAVANGVREQAVEAVGVPIVQLAQPIRKLIVRLKAVSGVLAVVAVGVPQIAAVVLFMIKALVRLKEENGALLRVAVLILGARAMDRLVQ